MRTRHSLASPPPSRAERGYSFPQSTRRSRLAARRAWRRNSRQQRAVARRSVRGSRQAAASWRFCWWLLCAPLAAALTVAARRLPGFAEWHVRHLYPLLARPLHAVSRLFRFSLMEVLCAVLLLALAVRAVRGLVRLARTKDGRARGRMLARAMLRLLCAGSAGLLAFVLLAGINYHRTSFAQLSGLPVQPSSTGELRQLCDTLAAQANALAAAQPAHDADSVTLCMEQGGWQALATAADAAYAAAAGDWPLLTAGYGHAKPMAASAVMSKMQLTGVFFPFTMEANVNVLAPSFNLPFTTAHELAHLRGFMREDEANFIAWLVCGATEDLQWRYSGTLMALIHAGNALAGADGEAYAALREVYSEQVVRDLAANNAYWAQFDDQPLSRLEETVNNGYLRANGQSEGARSYGRMVDLLLAWQRAGRMTAADKETPAGQTSDAA